MSAPGSPGPFHAGEVALQASLGVRDKLAALGPRLIRDHMPDQHRELFGKLPTMFVGTLDRDGQPWATIVHGPPGFVRTPDEHTLALATYPPADDPARAGLEVGAAVGLLGLEPHTRRRNRANGVIVAADERAWHVLVHQSFGNCPRYIHARAPVARPTPPPGLPTAEGARLSPAAHDLIARSDTLFLATSSAGRLTPADLAAGTGAGVDVSHRGGRAGFVAVHRRADGDELVVPDYAGNAMFCTLGNLLAWPRAGLLVLDYQRGDVLQLAATATVSTDGATLARFPGAQRLLALRVSGGWLRPAALPLAWTPPEAPPLPGSPAAGGA